jgi:hypothetical protein
MNRSLSTIASEIIADWRNMSPHARPYVLAMQELTHVTDLHIAEDYPNNYYADTAASVVIYFLSNAGSWRGETARRIKAELNAMVKEAR